MLGFGFKWGLIFVFLNCPPYSGMSHVAWGAAVSSEFLSKADTDASGAFAASLLLKGAQAKMSQGGRAVSEKPLAPLWDQPEAAPGNGKPLCISGGKGSGRTKRS